MSLDSTIIIHTEIWTDFQAIYIWYGVAINSWACTNSKLAIHSFVWSITPRFYVTIMANNTHVAQESTASTTFPRQFNTTSNICHSQNIRSHAITISKVLFFYACLRIFKTCYLFSIALIIVFQSFVRGHLTHMNVACSIQHINSLRTLMIPILAVYERIYPCSLSYIYAVLYIVSYIYMYIYLLPYIDTIAMVKE